MDDGMTVIYSSYINQRSVLSSPRPALTADALHALI